MRYIYKKIFDDKFLSVFNDYRHSCARMVMYFARIDISSKAKDVRRGTAGGIDSYKRGIKNYRISLTMIENCVKFRLSVTNEVNGQLNRFQRLKTYRGVVKTS